MSTKLARSAKTTKTSAAPSAIAAKARAGAHGNLIGYARVSSTDQSSATQESRLRAAGCTIVRTEKVSGRSRNGRDELVSIMDFIRSGDTLIVVKLDRLGRSTRDVLNLVHAGTEGSEPQGP
jgi:hypothetical protein